MLRNPVRRLEFEFHFSIHPGVFAFFFVSDVLYLCAGLCVFRAIVIVHCLGCVFIFSDVLQTVRGANLASYSMGAEGSFPGGEQSGREADHSRSSSA
jgi:hypothetical protein